MQDTQELHLEFFDLVAFKDGSAHTLEPGVNLFYRKELHVVLAAKTGSQKGKSRKRCDQRPKGHKSSAPFVQAK